MSYPLRRKNQSQNRVSSPRKLRGRGILAPTGKGFLVLLLAMASCRPRSADPRATSSGPASPPGAERPGGAAVLEGVPERFAELRFAPVPERDPPAVRVRSEKDAAVDFEIPATVLLSLIGDERVPVETRARAVLAFPGLRGALAEHPPAPPPSRAGAGLTQEIVLASSEQGTVRVTPDGSAAHCVRVQTERRTYRMPAAPALSVLNDERLSSDEKVRALLTFPTIETIAANSEP